MRALTFVLLWGTLVALVAARGFEEAAQEAGKKPKKTFKKLMPGTQKSQELCKLLLTDESGKRTDGCRTLFLSGGNFLQLEAVMKGVEGVLGVQRGYAGGYGGNDTTFENLCRKKGRGAAEGVLLAYDRNVTKPRNILVPFLESHNTSRAEALQATGFLNSQKRYMGSQYRSSILVFSRTQRNAAMRIFAEMKNTTGVRPVTRVAWFNGKFVPEFRKADALETLREQIAAERDEAAMEQDATPAPTFNLNATKERPNLQPILKQDPLLKTLDEMARNGSLAGLGRKGAALPKSVEADVRQESVGTAPPEKVEPAKDKNATEKKDVREEEAVKPPPPTASAQKKEE